MKSVRYLNGYRLIYRPDHPSAMSFDNWKGYVYKHIYIAEQELKQPLRKEGVVHHLNGNRKDNRPSNLLVLKSSQHGKLHIWIQSGAPYGTTISENPLNSGKPKLGNLRICQCCRETITNPGSKVFYSTKCQSISHRKVDRLSKEQLESDIQSMSWRTVGRKYNVTDNAVRRWAKTYGLIRQSWAKLLYREEGAETIMGGPNYNRRPKG